MLTDQKLDEAMSNVKRVLADKSDNIIHNPFFNVAIKKVRESDIVSSFETKLIQINESRLTTSSKTMSKFLIKCSNETKEALYQYRNGQLRSLILHLNTDIVICEALKKDIDATLSRSCAEEIIKQLSKSRRVHSWASAYFALGPVESEEAIQVHLKLTEILLEVLNPSHKKQHIQTVLEFAKATAGFVPGFNIFDYAVAVHKMDPTERIRIDLAKGDVSIQYWENYLMGLLEWIKKSYSFQLRIEDSVRHFTEITK